MSAGIPVIVNARSGQDSAEDASQAIAPAFAAHGLRARVIVLQPDSDLDAIVEAEIANGAPLVVAGGGDGTINAVASRLLDRPTMLGVLPLGTLNHFARDLGIPFELEAAVAVIARMQCVAVDAGQVNDRIFLNNSSIGLYPRIVIERDTAQQHLGLGKWPALVHATWSALRHPSSFSAVVCVDGDELQRRTPFIFVGNNAYVLEGFGIGKRARIDGGRLAVYVLRPKTAWGLLSLGMRALLGAGSHEQDFEAFEPTEFRVEASCTSIDVATDGEVQPQGTPLQYRIRPQALRVLVPRREGQATT